MVFSGFSMFFRAFLDEIHWIHHSFGLKSQGFWLKPPETAPSGQSSARPAQMSLTALALDHWIGRDIFTGNWLDLTIKYSWLVVLTILKNMKVNGKDYSYIIMENNKWLKPPTSIGFSYTFLPSSIASSWGCWACWDERRKLCRASRPAGVLCRCPGLLSRVWRLSSCCTTWDYIGSACPKPHCPYPGGHSRTINAPVCRESLDVWARLSLTFICFILWPMLDCES